MEGRNPYKFIIDTTIDTTSLRSHNNFNEKNIPL